MAIYTRFVERVLAEARAGAELQLLEPVERAQPPVLHLAAAAECDRTAPSAAVAPYVEMARALQAALDAAPGEQQLVLGELAGLDKRRPMTTSVSEFVADIPEDMACASAIWTQHGYVGGRDPVDDLERALARKGCRTADRSGSPRPASARRAAARSGGRRAPRRQRACGRLHRRLAAGTGTRA